MEIRTSYFSSLDPDAIRPRCKEKCIVRDHLSYMDEKRYLRTWWSFWKSIHLSESSSVQSDSWITGVPVLVSNNFMSQKNSCSVLGVPWYCVLLLIRCYCGLWFKPHKVVPDTSNAELPFWKADIYMILLSRLFSLLCFVAMLKPEQLCCLWESREAPSVFVSALGDST